MGFDDGMQLRPSVPCSGTGMRGYPPHPTPFPPVGGGRHPSARGEGDLDEGGREDGA